MKQLIKSTTEMGPLAIFFIFYLNSGLQSAIPPFIAATIIALPFSFMIEKKIPVLPLASAFLITFFGLLTIYFDNDAFFKMKPTILYVITGIILLISLRINKNILQYFLSNAMSLDDTGWYICAQRWAYFSFFLAVLNELIWRTQSTDIWVNFKVFGVLILTFLFTILQVITLEKYITDKTK